MTSPNWITDSVSLQDLRTQAEALEPWDWGVFGFLQNIGVVPWGVKSMPQAKIRLNIDPEEVPVGYLASAAYEWDSWGPSQPTDFINALECELLPAKRDFIVSLMSALGKTAE